MRLLALHSDTVDALARLHVPLDDLTPAGLWGTAFHLIGVGPDQHDVLAAWKLDFEDLTPEALDVEAAIVAEPLRIQGHTKVQVPVAARPLELPRETQVPLQAQDDRRPDAASATATTSTTTNAAANARTVKSAEGAKLRISIAGHYVEAAVHDGRIQIGDRSYPTPDEASRSLDASHGDWAFWEYFDGADGKWRLLDREWPPE